MPDNFLYPCDNGSYPQGLSNNGASEYCENMKDAFNICVNWYVDEQGSKVANAKSICKKLITGTLASGKYLVDRAIDTINASDESGKNASWKTGVIIAGSVLGAAVIGTVIGCLCCKNKKNANEHNPSDKRTRVIYDDIKQTRKNNIVPASSVNDVDSAVHTRGGRLK